MLNYSLQKVYLKKRFPLEISRGRIFGSENLFMCVSDGIVSGWGEMAPPGKTEGAGSAEEGQSMLDNFFKNRVQEDSISRIYDEAINSGVHKCALACLDMALWDLLSKQAKMPLHRLLGLPPVFNPTSLTVGINPPEVIKERIPIMLEGSSIKELKVKLGSENGIEADKDMFSMVFECSKKYNTRIRVDANGGWTLSEARKMMKWLADRGIEYVEQPLKAGAEDDLLDLFKNRALPIFVDESCHIAKDIPPLADRSDGINLKLMKCGGITEALRMVGVARALGLKTMIGCMGESSISIAAGCAIGGLFDFIDLDSHLNLDPDPSAGLNLKNGVVEALDAFGHGGYLKDA
jgi:muconate cycloisomerase